MTFPQPPDVRPTTTTTVSLDLRRRLSFTYTAMYLGPPADPIDIDLIVRSIPHNALLVDKPFWHSKLLLKTLSF